MKRYQAINAIAEVCATELIITCNGMISREMHAARDTARNFYMLGSMGLAPAIALGAAIAHPNEKFVVIIGDGNLLMSLGTLATIAKVSPKNLIIVVLDNECHESTGGQETASSVVNFTSIAIASGLKDSHQVHEIDKLKEILKYAKNKPKCFFIHTKVEIERENVSRIRIDPPKLLGRFKKELEQ